MKKKNDKKKIVDHLKDDIKTFKHEASEDRELIRDLKGSKKKDPKPSMSNAKIAKVMKEWKDKKLHSGSKHGPLVKSQAQALAIAKSEAKKNKK